MDLQALTTNRLGSGGKQNLFAPTKSVSESSLWLENRTNEVADSIQKGGGMGVAGGLHGGAAKGGRRNLTIETNPKKDFKDDIIDDLNKDLQKLQKCVTCVICHDMLFEPFSLQCGHVFCYTCMVDWLGLYKKRTCPECRSVVKTQPAPAYLIRDMIETFVHRAELTSPHGTGSELRKQQREALAAIERDRAAEGKETGGLFKGMFKKKGPRGLRGFMDPADGVTRCPTCNWEVEDGLCTNCGVGVREPRGHVFSDSDEDESDESDDDDDDDDSGDSGSDSADLSNQFGHDPEQEFDDEEDEDEEEDEDDEDEEEDEDDEEGDEWQDEEDVPVYNNVGPPGRNAGFPGPHATNRSQVHFHQIHHSGSSRNIPTSQTASQEFHRGDEFRMFPSSGTEGAGRSDTEGSLADFVEHDTPENRRRLQRGNTGNGNTRVIQQITINSSPILISSTPASSSNVPPRRRGRRVVMEDEDENDSSFSSAAPGQAALRNTNDFPSWPEDDVQQFGYSPLGEVTTASENDDDTLSSPPGRRLRRGGPPSSGGSRSVPSVPEEDEESGSGRFGDDDDSEDEDGDIIMTGTRNNARRGANGRRTQNRGGNRTRPVEVQDSDSDLDIQPRPARRNGRGNTSSSNRSIHGRNAAGNNRSTNSRGRFNPNLQNIFSAHHQQREQTQYDALARYSVSPARSITPVQRQHTGESRRNSTPLRSMEQSNPPMSPLIRLSNDPPTPASTQSHLPPSLSLLSPMQSPVQNSRQSRAGGLGPPAEHQIINNSRPILSNPPSDMQQAPRAGSMVFSPPGLRVRGRSSRQQLRGTSSRAGLRGGSITPTQSLTTSNLAARRQNTVSLERDAIFARGAAAIGRRQQAPPRDPAGTQLGRRNSRISLNPNTNQSQSQVQSQSTAAETSRVTTRGGQQVGSASGRIGVPIANGPVSQSSGGPLWALSGDDR
ncbi:unnamed protein product [Tuber aestivum]|uniref:RING-type domain-containing protein n=1 Tax=Tuber aestivum TaxID=59557 RepID=A0A292PVQ5_9PEZI|nr:unnamed protein product [Tuber aestivum]